MGLLEEVPRIVGFDVENVMQGIFYFMGLDTEICGGDVLFYGFGYGNM
jgi:hypothetical protein